ncbi:hypothetical protein TNCV_1908851 [Trichonephila clavipes]|nr:hypothetical protein TNCV_1908851 [Trichonephila clavipes]
MSDENVQLGPPVEHNASSDNSRSTVLISFRGATRMKPCLDLTPIQLTLFELNTIKDPPRRKAMQVKTVESSNVLPLVWQLGEGVASSGVVLATWFKLRDSSPKALAYL